VLLLMAGCAVGAALETPAQQQQIRCSNVPLLVHYCGRWLPDNMLAHTALTHCRSGSNKKTKVSQGGHAAMLGACIKMDCDDLNCGYWG
jgi:hypothetical protein